MQDTDPHSAFTPGHAVPAHHLRLMMPTNVSTLTHRPSASLQGRTVGSTTFGLPAYARAPALRHGPHRPPFNRFTGCTLQLLITASQFGHRLTVRLLHRITARHRHPINRLTVSHYPETSPHRFILPVRVVPSLSTNLINRGILTGCKRATSQARN